MDSWRLSKIEEELDRLDFAHDPDAELPRTPSSNFGTLERSKSRDHTPNGTLERLLSRTPTGSMERGRSLTPSGTLERSRTPSGTLERHRSLTPSGSLERSHSFSNTVDARDVSEEIYSKIVVKKGYSREDMEQEAIKHFTGKYESLGKVMLGAMSPTLQPKSSMISQGAHEEDKSLPTVFPEPIAHLPPASPQLKSPTSPVSRKDIVRPRTKPPPLPPSVSSPTSPALPHTASPALPNTASPQPSSASSTFSEQQTNLRRSHSQSSHHSGRRASSLTEADITQVEMFYRSHKTEVFVCQCMANLYEGSIKNWTPSRQGEPPSHSVEIWNFVKPGIPVFVLDSGESRRNRKLSMMLGERGTGFPLWKETVTHLTNYRAEKATFHTLHIASDHTKMMALSFDDPVAANEFIHILQNILSNPDDDILNLSGRQKKKKDQKKKPKPKYKAPQKADISSPCCFTHVTNLNAGDSLNKVASATPPPPSRNSGGSSTASATASKSLSSLPRPRSIPTT